MDLNKKRHVLFLIFLLTSFAMANDTYLGTRSGNIYPDQKADSIQMIKERVHIKLSKDMAHVKCTFWLFNSGSQKRIVVGFPNFYYSFNASKPVENFTCKVNGETTDDIVSVKLEKTYLKYQGSKFKNTPAEEHWYTWDLSIDEKDTVKIENEYDGKWSGNACERFFTYIIGTGSSWDGPILDGNITFDHSELVSTNFVIRKTNDDNLKPVYFDDSTVYTFKNYTPKPRESLSLWIFTTDWIPMDNSLSNPCPHNSSHIKTAQKAIAIRNEFYALHGYKFDDKDIAAYYSDRKWYKIDPSFDPAKLSDGDNKFLSNLTRIENMFNRNK